MSNRCLAFEIVRGAEVKTAEGKNNVADINHRVVYTRIEETDHRAYRPRQRKLMDVREEISNHIEAGKRLRK